MVSGGPVEVENMLPVTLSTAPLMQHKYSSPILELKFFHTAIRAELHSLHQEAVAIERGTEEDLYELLQRYLFLRKVYRYHSSGEDEVILPALDLRVKNVANAYSLEHKIESDLFEQVSDLLAAALKAKGSARAALLRKLICCSEALLTCLIQHLSKEEEQLLPLLLEHFTAEEQAMLMWQFLCCIPVNLMEECLPWMASFLTEDELEEMVFHMHVIVPGEGLRQQVFSNLLLRGEASLQNVMSRWKELLQSTGNASSAEAASEVGEAAASTSSRMEDVQSETRSISGTDWREDRDGSAEDAMAMAMEVDQGMDNLKRFPINELYHWHNAIRKELEVFAEEAKRIQSTGVLTADDLTSFAERYRFLADVCFFHSTAEDKVVFPALDKKVKVPSLYYHQHAEEERQFVDVGRLLESAQLSAGNGSKTALELFTELSAQAEAISAAVQRHLLAEEVQVLPLVRHHCSVEEQRVLVYQSLREMPLRLLERVLPWVVACVSEEEAADMNYNMRRAAPEVDSPLVTLFSGWARKSPPHQPAKHMGEELGRRSPVKPAAVKLLAAPGTPTAAAAAAAAVRASGSKLFPEATGAEATLGDTLSEGESGETDMTSTKLASEAPEIKEDADVAALDRPAKRLRESSPSPPRLEHDCAFKAVALAEVEHEVGPSSPGPQLGTWPGLSSGLTSSVRCGTTMGSAWANGMAEKGGGFCGGSRKPIDTIFQFHQALRTDLEYLDIESAKLGEADDETVNQFSGQFQFLWGLYRAHSNAEDEIVFPALEAKEALHNVSHSYTIDHKQEEMFFEEIAQVLGELQDLISRASRAAPRRREEGEERREGDGKGSGKGGLGAEEKCKIDEVEGTVEGVEEKGTKEEGTEIGEVAKGEMVESGRAESGGSLAMAEGANAEIWAEDLKQMRKLLGQRLHRMCSSVRVSLDQHVSREEVELWPLFEVHFTEEEQDQIVGRIIGTTGAEVLQAMLPWITKALTEEEQSRMMNTWRQATRNTMFDQWLSAWWTDSGASPSAAGAEPKAAPAEEAEPDVAESLQMVVDYFQSGGLQDGGEGAEGAEGVDAVGHMQAGQDGSRASSHALGKEVEAGEGGDVGVEAGDLAGDVDGGVEGDVAIGKVGMGGSRTTQRRGDLGSTGSDVAGEGDNAEAKEGDAGPQSGVQPPTSEAALQRHQHHHSGACGSHDECCGSGAEVQEGTEGGAAAGRGAYSGSGASCKGQKEVGREEKKFKPGWQDIFRMNQQELEQAIRKVSSDKSLDPRRKAYLIQNLMTSRWIVAQQKKPGSEADGGEDGEAGISGRCPSYQDEAQTVFGCEHYMRNCKLKAACCGQLFTCRFCHDKVSDHSMNRQATQEMMCMKCLQVQPVAQTCATPSCNAFPMARYFCAICKLFDNDESRPIYHCPFCNLCRVGKGLGVDYFHCMTCNACMSMTLATHKCREKGLEANCPICHDFLFTSNTPVKALSCGHFMHSTCFQAYTSGHYTCPICSKSLGDMGVYFGMLDALLASEQLPEEYRDRRQDILCNDCEKKATAPFHWLYHKCQHCGSYNTRTI